MSDDNLCMLRYYKRHVIRLKDMLDALDPQADDLTPLGHIQDYLIDRVLDVELKISKQKKKRKDLKHTLRTSGATKIQSNDLRRQISSCDSRISGYKFLLYVWRCFGDGIANKYISKWNLKRLFYAHDSPKMKQSPGYLGDKQGILAERSLLGNALSHNVPAVLCDLTNIIKHGDICLLGASDPYVIEIKSSANTSRRTERQLFAINTIHEYLQNDVGNIGGFSAVQRRALPVEETHHNSSINEVALEAANGQAARASPEEGLLYIGVPTGKMRKFEKMLEGIDDSLAFMLNQVKTEKCWGNYYPFTLSLRDSNTLYAFLSGSIFLLVFVSHSSLHARANAAGFELHVVMANGVGFELKNRESAINRESAHIISEHFVGRLAFEFLSLDWFFENERIMINDLEGQLLRGLENA